MTLIAGDTERERRRAIVAQARRNVERLEEDELRRAEIDRLTGPELARRLAGSDPVEEWRKAGEPYEWMRRKQKRERDRRLDAAPPPSPPPDYAAIDARVEVERRIVTEIMGEIVAEERAAAAYKLGQEVRKLRAEIERERIARACERASARETHARDFAEVTRRFAALERQLDQLGAKRTDDKLDAVRDDLTVRVDALRQEFVVKSN
jgi:hypothetical protein